ncbi:hypothetical protein VNI00_005598 [Paramarasmius palmivorus]|uniref:RING-type domain-containing protein n=1 Tax=Paramarasmius palmivorus TaxID=297713 RepID=A0AAW0DDC9_9AGAR
MDHHDNQQLVAQFIDTLPSLDAEQVTSEECCPICLISFQDLLDEKQTNSNDPWIGITQLATCKHIFCKKDLVEWIRGLHGNCPTCRRAFLDISPPSESDGESSDGGEYVPNTEDDDEEDSFYIDTDGFTDAEGFESEGMDLDDFEAWEEGCIDAEDVEFDTDGDSSMVHSDEAFGDSEIDDIAVSVHEDNGETAYVLEDVPGEK